MTPAGRNHQDQFKLKERLRSERWSGVFLMHAFTRFFPSLVLMLTGSLMLALSSRAGSHDAGEAPQHVAGWTLACVADNDLVRVLTASGIPCTRCESAIEAVNRAGKGTGVLILADGYPDQQTVVDSSVWEQAARKELRLYVEYPAQLPGIEIGSPRDVGYERAVVSSGFFGDDLPRHRILMVSSCRYVRVQASQTHLVVAKVAGVDTAAFGLEDVSAEPLLFEHPRGNLLVATAKLSQFVTGRYLPAEDWRTIWGTILAWLAPDAPRVELHWTSTVRPRFDRSVLLPEDVQSQAVRRAADWIVASRTLRHPDWPREVLDLSLTYNTVRDKPRAEWPLGDGSWGILEGFSSTIRRDGAQPMRYAVRNDCTTEVAMLLALDAVEHARTDNARRAVNLVTYVFDGSGLAMGPRSDPDSPSYGLVGWALDHPGSYWGDDNARALLAVGATAALTDQRQWDASIARCILANFRTTGVHGFRPSCVQEHDLQTLGWQAYWNSQHTHFSPHYQSWLWACNFWAYAQTGFEPLRARSRTGIQLTMQAYPQQWDWCLRSGTIERSRMLLPLAWLVRVDDTPEHRRWLRWIAEDLVALQDPSGAIREVIGDGGHALPSNAAYGTGETSLIQTNADSVADMLYSCNFALIGLHEAAAATGDKFFAEAADHLADFLCRIQIRSEVHPELDGAWYRAFDFRRWDYWASSADWEWGPWCTETGWCQPWIAGTLALRCRNTSLWELVQRVDLKPHFAQLRPRMLPDDVLKSEGTPGLLPSSWQLRDAIRHATIEQTPMSSRI